MAKHSWLRPFPACSRIDAANHCFECTSDMALEHTDIVAFATIFVAALVLVSGTFWATGPATNRKIALGEQRSQTLNQFSHRSVSG